MSCVVNSKHENHRLLMQGEYGNTIQNWMDIEEVRQSGFKGQVGLRSWTPGFRTVYHIDQHDMEKTLREAKWSYPRHEFYWSGMTPDDHLRLQGEFIDGMRNGSYVHRSLTYSTIQKPMKIAFMQETKHVDGIAAEIIIRNAMDDQSHEKFMELRERYSNAAIEFSCWDIPMGTLGWNTVFWEVRDY